MDATNGRYALGSVEELTAQWCTTALAEHLGGAKVTGCDTSPVGTGQVSDTVRLALRYDPPGAGPPTLVAKVTAASDTSRAAARATRTYEVEAAFYRELAPTLPVRTPRCYLSAYDTDSDAYTVVLEDLAPAQQGDQLVGCTPDEAAQALAEMARLHGPRWGDPTLAGMPWLSRSSEENVRGLAALVGASAAGFVERYADGMEAEVLELLERFIPQIGSYMTARAGSWTVTHGDFRVDNLLFGGDRVAVVDWQTVAHGPGPGDLAYFLGASLPVAARREHEKALVAEYLDGVRAFGVELSPEDCWTDYRRYAFGGVIMAVIASMLVERTERGDQMFLAMVNRHGQHALDLDAERLIP